MRYCTRICEAVYSKPMLPILMRDMCHFIPSPVLCLLHAPVAVRGAQPRYTVCGAGGRLIVVAGDCRRCETINETSLDELYDAYMSLTTLVASRARPGSGVSTILRKEYEIGEMRVVISATRYSDEPEHETIGTSENLKIDIRILDYATHYTGTEVGKHLVYERVSRLYDTIVGGASVGAERVPDVAARLDKPVLAAIAVHYSNLYEMHVNVIVVPRACIGVEIPESNGPSCTALSVSLDRLHRLAGLTGFPLLDLIHNDTLMQSRAESARLAYALATMATGVARVLLGRGHHG